MIKKMNEPTVESGVMHSRFDLEDRLQIIVKRIVSLHHILFPPLISRKNEIMILTETKMIDIHLLGR